MQNGAFKIIYVSIFRNTDYIAIQADFDEWNKNN